MTSNRHITLFYSPNTRASATRLLLDELGADYELHVLNMKAGEQRGPDYLAINPMGKVPAIMHGDVLVTEQVAIFLYLADLYPEARLAPPLGDPLRGPYLRWMVYYGSCFEPAVTDKSMKREPAPPSSSPYGDFDTMLKTLTDQLGKGDYMLGDRFSAVDLLWGSALTWMVGWGLVPKLPVIQAYVDRMSARPAAVRVKEKDAELAATQG